MKISNSLSLLFDKNKNIIFNNNNNNNNNSNSNNNLNIFNSTSYLNNNNNININDFKNQTNYIINQRQNLIQEKEKYKKYYELYKDKYNSIKEKYSSIFNIYEEALEKIYNEYLQNENKDIFININEFKKYKFNYEEMTPKEKYFILIKLIKHISPLVFKKEIEKNIFTEQLLNVKEKYVIGNNNGKSLSFSTDQNSLDISLGYKKRKNKKIYDWDESYSNGLNLKNKKHIKLGRFLKNNKNKNKIFLEFTKNFNIVPITPLESIPIKDFYNGPFSSI